MGFKKKCPRDTRNSMRTAGTGYSRGVAFCICFADAPKTYDTVSNGIRPAIATPCLLKTGQAVCLGNNFHSLFFVRVWCKQEGHCTYNVALRRIRTTATVVER